MDKKVLYDLSYGVYLTTTMDGERPTGCVTNSVMQITSAPMSIAVSVNHENYTNSCMKKCGKFAVSILAQDSDPALIGTFGFQSGRDVDKFETVACTMVEGVPVVNDAMGAIVCRIIDTMETATHTVFLGEVIDACSLHPGTAMTYAYYHDVIKGKSPKHAPTYQAEEESGPAVRYRCRVCGYIYEGDPLPPDFKCPICGVGAEMFEKVAS